MTRSSQISRVGWGVPKKMEECERHRQCSKQRRTETSAFCQTKQSLVTLNDFSVIFKARYCLRHFSIHVISLEERVFRRHFLTNIASCASSWLGIRLGLEGRFFLNTFCFWRRFIRHVGDANVEQQLQVARHRLEPGQLPFEVHEGDVDQKPAEDEEAYVHVVHVWGLHQRDQNQAQADSHCHQREGQEHLRKGWSRNNVSYESPRAVPAYSTQMERRFKPTMENGSIAIRLLLGGTKSDLGDRNLLRGSVPSPVEVTTISPGKYLRAVRNLCQNQYLQTLCYSRRHWQVLMMTL